MANYRLCFLFTIFISMVSFQAFAYDIAVENDDGVTIYYNYTSDGKELEVTCLYYNPPTISQDYKGFVVIPEEVTYMNRTRKVTRIGDNAFRGCSNLTSIDIPNSVTSIGNYAFRYCRALTSIDIPNSVTSIGNDAFSSCSGLTSVTIPNSVTSIGGGAFSNCSGLTSVTIGNSVASIGTEAFYGCSSLSKVIVKDIASWCNVSFRTFANPLYYAHHLYSDENTEITDLIIPNSVTSIGDYAFSGANLTSVIIPNSVTSIGGWAFQNCSNLTSVTIGNSVTSIGNNAFGGCLILTSVTIPNSVTTIGNQAFHYCSSLTSVTIGNSVTSIGTEAFSNCSSLSKVIVKDIFSWCNVDFGSNPLWYAHHLYSDENTEITDLIIPNTVTSIGDYAFSGCSSLTSVTIPNSVTHIGDEAFANCDILEVISMIENPFDINNNTFSENAFYNATLYVPTGTIDKYKATEGWKKFVFIEEGNGGGGAPPEPSKCAKPTIYYSNGKLSYKSETEGVSFNSTISDTDMGKYRDDEVQLSVTYHISVYASKNGYQDSEVAEATLCWIEVDPQKEGITEDTQTDAKQMKAMPVLIQAVDGQISVEGAPEGTKVAVYDASGMEVGSAISRGGTTLVPARLPSSSIAIVKIGEKAVKLAVK